MYDSFGDGLCCSNGYYSVKFDGDLVHYSDFPFGREETTTFGESCPSGAPSFHPSTLAAPKTLEVKLTPWRCIFMRCCRLIDLDIPRRLIHVVNNII